MDGYKQQLVGWDFYDETKYKYLLLQVFEKKLFYFFMDKYQLFRSL